MLTIEQLLIMTAILLSFGVVASKASSKLAGTIAVSLDRNVGWIGRPGSYSV